WFWDSVTLHRDLGDRLGAAVSLFNLGLVAWRLGELEEARRRSEESLRIWHELRHQPGAAFGLGGLATGAYAQGHRERAGRLRPGGGAPGESSGARRLPAEQPLHEALVAQLREGLAGAVFAAAWAAGQAMPLEQAVAYALEEAPATA